MVELEMFCVSYLMMMDNCLNLGLIINLDLEILYSHSTLKMEK